MNFTVSHIINPFDAHSSSDLHLAQPITFKSMLKSKKLCQYSSQINLCFTKYESDTIQLPNGFTELSNLTSSILDKQSFETSIKLPLIADIINKAHETDSDYIIYTNVDIALMPNFYSRVFELIASGHDALIINRRRISSAHFKHGDLNKMEADRGLAHPGFDCFVFKKSLIDKMVLKDICIGVPFIGITLSQNLFALAHKLRIVQYEHFTYHVGLEIFKKRAPKEYRQYNRKQFQAVMNELLPKTKLHNWPYSDKALITRLVKTVLNPSTPIRWRIKAEKNALRRK